MSPIGPKTIGLIAIGVIAIGVITAAFLLFGADPAAAARSKYKQATGQPSTQATITPTPAPAVPPPIPGSVDKVDIEPPGKLAPGADFSSKPDVVETSTELPKAPVKREPDQDANNIPPPPPVPAALLNGTLQTSQSEAPPTVVAPRVEVAQSRYMFNNLSPGALNGNAGLSGSGSNTGSAFVPDKFAPETSIIHLALAGNVISEDDSIPVVSAVWFPFYSQGHKLLDVGDRLIGSSNGAKKRDRLQVTFTRVIRARDSKSFPIKAIALDLDGSLGIPGKQVGSVLLNAIGPVLLEAVVGFTSTLQQRVLVGSSGTQAGFQTASGGVQVTPTLANGGVGAAQGAMEKVQNLLTQDMEENKPYLVIPAGTRLDGMLTAPLDTSNPDYGR